MYAVVAAAFAGTMVLRWYVLFQLCVAHRGSLELFHQLSSLVSNLFIMDARVIFVPSVYRFMLTCILTNTG